MRHILIVISLLVSTHVIGQFTSTGDSDSEATKILDQVRDKIDNAEAYKVDFGLTVNYPESDPIVMEGTIFQKGESFHLDMTDYLIISNNTLRWVMVKADLIASIYNADTETGWVTPADFLKIYDATEFVYTLLDEQRAPDQSSDWIEFKSLDVDFDFSKVRISVDRKTKLLKTVSAFSKDGSRYQLAVHNIDFSPDLSDVDFSFDPAKYPGVKIEDLRID